MKKQYEIIRKYALYPGKRLRPISLVLSYLSTGGKDLKKVILPALAIELYHTYTLILDDLMDEDEFRREKPTVFKIEKDLLETEEMSYSKGILFNSRESRNAASITILLGILTGMFSRKAIHMSDISYEKKCKILSLIDRMDEIISEGQMKDIYSETKTVSEKQYIDMIMKKTAELFAVPMMIGAILSGSDEHVQEAFYNIGLNMAISFQIQDDIIDITPGKGRIVGSDILNKKKTLLIIKLLESVSEENMNIFRKIFSERNITQEGINKIIKMMEETGAILYSKKLSEKYLLESKRILKNLNIDPVMKEKLFSLIDFMSQRTF